MKLLSVVALLLALLGSTRLLPGSPTPTRRPAPAGGGGGWLPGELLRLYANCDFQGDAYVAKETLLQTGITRTTVLAGSRYFLDNTSSLQVKPGAYTVRLYQHPNYSDRQPYEVPEWGVRCLPPGWNDKIQAIGVTPCVIFYQDSDFRGPLFTSSGRLSPVPEAVPGANTNDQVSAVRIPQGWTLTLFEHANGQGRKVVLQHDVADLRSLNFNDITSSFRAENPKLHRID